MTFKELINRVRPTPLDEILSAHGLSGIKEGNSVRYKDATINIVVTENKWYDNKAGIGGAGPIDLVSHLRGYSFRDAVLWLDGSCSTIPSFLSASSCKDKNSNECKILSYPEAREQYAVRDDSRWAEARSYLVEQRRLQADIVDIMFKNGNLYATKKGGIAFVHLNVDGEEVGCSIRSIQHCSKFHQSIGKKTTGWFSVGNLKTAKTILVAESAIDALSLATLHPMEPNTAVVAVSGAYSPLPLLEHAFRNGAKLIAAYDNDEAGINAKEQLHTTWKELTHGKGTFLEKIPIKKDWNEDLCRSYQQKNQKWTIFSDLVESSVRI